MKPYGMTRREIREVDKFACAAHGRATRIYAIAAHAFRSLRGGRKAAARRTAKRIARRAGVAACDE